MTCAPGATPGGTNVGNVHVARGGEQWLRSRQLARRAALYRCICSTLDNDSRQDSRQDTELHPTYVCINPQLRQFHKVGYEDAKTWMERRLAGMKSGVPNWAATTIEENGHVAWNQISRI